MLLWLWGCAGPSGVPDDDSTTGSTTKATSPPPDAPLRIVTWNVEALGDDGSAQYEATRSILLRLDADVVGLNEILEGEEDALVRLATDLGYEVVQPRTNPFGAAHNALLSRLETQSGSFPSSAVLSDDPAANDVTRWPVSLAVTAPWGETVAVTVQHCKAGFDLDDRFRRSVDTHRLGQAARRVPAAHHVAMGDINEDPADLERYPPSPERWSFPPAGLPAAYELGDDVRELLDGEGLDNHPFDLLEGFGLSDIDARQPDGRAATRDSGRRIDHVLLTSGLRAVATEIYDSQDEGLDALVAKAGEPLDRPASRAASDHLPVVVDLRPN